MVADLEVPRSIQTCYWICQSIWIELFYLNFQTFFKCQNFKVKAGDGPHINKVSTLIVHTVTFSFESFAYFLSCQLNPFRKNNSNAQLKENINIWNPSLYLLGTLKNVNVRPLKKWTMNLRKVWKVALWYQINIKPLQYACQEFLPYWKFSGKCSHCLCFLHYLLGLGWQMWRLPH